MSKPTPTLQRVRFEEVTPANEYAAFFNASIESLVAHLDLPIFEGYDDLDALRFTFLTLPSGETITLGQYPRAPEPGTYLYVVNIVPETYKLVVAVCQQLKIAASEILWTHPDFQGEFDGLYATHGDFHREHESPEFVESWESSDYEPIDCFQYALKIYTRQQFPEYWAMLQHNLGLAFYHRSEGDRSENLERSIECFNNSLQVYTQSEFPVKWEINQQDLSETNRALIEFSNQVQDRVETQQNVVDRLFQSRLSFMLAFFATTFFAALSLVGLGLLLATYLPETALKLVALRLLGSTIAISSIPFIYTITLLNNGLFTVNISIGNFTFSSNPKDYRAKDY